MQNIAQVIECIAPSDLGVVLVGEYGTGKSWVARAIHQLSNRAHHRMIGVDCTLLPAKSLEEFIFGYEVYIRTGIEVNTGIFEDASGGTILFDEVSNFPIHIQKKISLVLEHQYIRRIGARHDTPVDVRFIAALDRKAGGMIDDGVFWKELHRRISPIIINLPPLRERRGDIPILIENFIEDIRQRSGQTEDFYMHPEAIEICQSYDWPGNISELRDAIEYAVMINRSGAIEPKHLPIDAHKQKRIGFGCQAGDTQFQGTPNALPRVNIIRDNTPSLSAERRDGVDAPADMHPTKLKFRNQDDRLS